MSQAKKALHLLAGSPPAAAPKVDEPLLLRALRYMRDGKPMVDWAWGAVADGVREGRVFCIAGPDSLERFAARQAKSR